MATSDDLGGSIGAGILERRGSRRARSTGLAVAAAGILIFNVSPFLNWVDPRGDANPPHRLRDRLAYPLHRLSGPRPVGGDGVRDEQRPTGQHRGLTLVSMAVGIAATLQCLAFAINPMGALERGDDLATQIGVYLGLLGAVIWAIGSGLLAKEIEGDDDDYTDAYTPGPVPRPLTAPWTRHQRRTEAARAQSDGCTTVGRCQHRWVYGCPRIAPT